MPAKLTNAGVSMARGNNAAADVARLACAVASVAVPAQDWPPAARACAGKTATVSRPMQPVVLHRCAQSHAAARQQKFQPPAQAQQASQIAPVAPQPHPRSRPHCSSTVRQDSAATRTHPPAWSVRRCGTMMYTRPRAAYLPPGASYPACRRTDPHTQLLRRQAP